MNKIKMLSLSAVVLTAFSVTAPSFVAVTKADTVNQVQNKIGKSEEVLTLKEMKELSDFKSATGLSSEKIKEIETVDTSRIYLENGKVYIDGIEQKDLQRGKLSWAIKAIRTAYKKLPDNIKKWIASYIGFETFLNILDGYTGAVTDGIKWVLESSGMPSWMADFCAKTITTFIL
jgi:hypothetical protein